MNGLNCSVTRRRRQDLNRRKVAAISFLANMTVEGETESDWVQVSHGDPGH